MQNKNEYGTIEIAHNAIKDIVNITTRKINGIIPIKKGNSYINVIEKKDNTSIHLNVKVKPGIDVVKTCQQLQNDIHDALSSMIQIDISNINVNIDGFITGKE